MPSILFVTSEIHPFVKTGGLADVSGSLPAALFRTGIDIRILVPGYHGVLSGLGNKHLVATLPATASRGEVRLLRSQMPETGVPVYVVDYPAYYFRDGGPYQSAQGGDWPDNAARFGLLSQVAALLGSDQSPLSWKPEIVHANDWQSGLAPAWLRLSGENSAKSVMTIHNLAFQGNFSRDWVSRVGLPESCFAMNGVEFHGHFSFLKAGLYYSDRITTVSPSYAREIQAPEMGCGMDGLLSFRSKDVSGILNGIDEIAWNPATDSQLAANYDSLNLGGKAACKSQLQQELGLEANRDAPLLGVVSRLTYQKGLDLVLECSHQLIRQGAQLAVLGSGDHEFERSFLHLAEQYPGRVSVKVGFDEALSHRIMAGVDIFLMPSRFEPCGLNQLYGMRYGTPPLVRKTGGLADSVIDAAEPSGTGFVFTGSHHGAVLHAIERAIACFRDRDHFERVQRNGMRQDFSWKGSADKYIALYRELTGKA